MSPSTPDLDVVELAEADAPLALLDAAEAAHPVPLVDETERERLEALARGETVRPAGWRSWLARRAGQPVGYAAVVFDAAAGPAGPTGDLAVPRWARADRAVVAALVDHVGEVFASLGATGTVWLRDADEPDVEVARDHGARIRRRLGVLGRALDAPPDVPDGPTIRTYRPDVDDAAVVEVLDAAYAGTDDGGWTLARFRDRRASAWFDPADLLLAEDTHGTLLGLHWLKRRDAATGEVYNLAVHPRAQGRGAGPRLLAAGLAHLHAVGCREVLLWVDLSNQRAVRLYREQGFTTRWVDVALELGAGAGASGGAMAGGDDTAGEPSEPGEPDGPVT